MTIVPICCAALIENKKEKPETRVKRERESVAGQLRVSRAEVWSGAAFECLCRSDVALEIAAAAAGVSSQPKSLRRDAYKDYSASVSYLPPVITTEIFWVRLSLSSILTASVT